MVAISVEIHGIEEVNARLAALPDKIRHPALLKLAQIVYDSAQRGADRHTKTGRLARSVFNRPLGDGREVGHDLGQAPHAIFVHWGTKPHVIRPKTRKALRWPSGSGFVFAKFANHPGYRGDPWLVAAVDDARSRFSEVIEAVKREI